MAKFEPQAELPVSEQAQIRRDKLAALQAEGRDPFIQTVVNDAQRIADEDRAKETESPWQYKVGDTVYLDDTAFRIEQIRDREVQLLDPTLAYPVYRAESKERFEAMLAQDERNSQFREITIQQPQMLAPPAPKPKAPSR